MADDPADNRSPPSITEGAADALGDAVRVGLKLAALPTLVLPRGMRDALLRILRGAARESAHFPRAVYHAFDTFADGAVFGPRPTGGPAGDRGTTGDGGDSDDDRPGDNEPEQRIFRERAEARAAIIFIHGFYWDLERTWGVFPRYLVEDSRLDAWDVFSIGYDTSLLPDIGLWSASPPLDRLAQLLRTNASERYGRYQTLAFVAHSMGGLVLQRALVDDRAFARRVSHVAMFGAPSNGLVRAAYLRFWKRQIADMTARSPFILDLRRRWRRQIGEAPTFRLVVAAGDKDEFVPASSSLTPFPEAQQAVVPGDHLTIVNPRSAGDLSVRLVIRHLLGDAAPAGPLNSALVAIESRHFQRAIDQLWPNRQTLDPTAKVQLALALDSVGRQGDAIQVLESAGKKTTDQLGTLGGRFKRRWLAERRQADGDRSLALYRQGLAGAQAADDPHQIYYHAINVAFMELAFLGRRTEARTAARLALDACQRAEAADPAAGRYWRQATRGEALLLLGDERAALDAYRLALTFEPAPWQIISTYHQALGLADLLGSGAAAERLRHLFRHEAPAGGTRPQPAA